MLVLLRTYVNRERESDREREQRERQRERHSERQTDTQTATYCTHIMTRIHVLNTHTHKINSREYI